jgi:hypothetical protein
MSTVYLITTWIVFGLLVGALALAARFKPASWNTYGWPQMLALGAGSALLGGLLGFWLAGRLFSTPVALWLAVLATSAPWLYHKLRTRLAKTR